MKKKYKILNYLIILFIIFSNFSLSHSNEKYNIDENCERKILNKQLIKKKNELLIIEYCNALKNLSGKNLSKLNVTIAINFYIWRNYERTANASGWDPVEIIRQKDAQCQGRAILMAYLLDFYNIKSMQIAFWQYPENHAVIGVEIEENYFSIFDPLNGSFFFNHNKNKILSIEDLKNKESLHMIPTYNNKPLSDLLKKNIDDMNFFKHFDLNKKIYFSDLRYSVSIGLNSKTLKNKQLIVPNKTSLFQNGNFNALECEKIPSKFINLDEYKKLNENNEIFLKTKSQYALNNIFRIKQYCKNLTIRVPNENIDLQLIFKNKINKEKIYLLTIYSDYNDSKKQIINVINNSIIISLKKKKNCKNYFLNTDYCFLNFEIELDKEEQNLSLPIKELKIIKQII